MRFLSQRLGDRKTLFFWGVFGLTALGVALLGFLGGLIFGYALDLPEVEQLQEVRPNIVSSVYSQDERVLGQFALEKRILVTYDQIPATLRQAIISAEDANFFEHTGIDPWRIAITAVRDILLGERKGASTLTMQLSKILFTSPVKTLKRKIQDALFAVEIEKNYTKSQIFTFYCNQIYMGHGVYGMAAAAEFYFGKPLEELTLPECALLAGIIRSPENYSPIKHPKRAVGRRNYALRRMYDEGYIDEPTLKKALQSQLEVRGRNFNQNVAPYFVEWVRQYLEKNYSTEQIWKGGLKIYTTVNYDMQVAAEKSLRKGLEDFDKDHNHWQGAAQNVLKEGKSLDQYRHADWRKFFQPGQMIHGLVLESDRHKAEVRLGSYTATITPKEIKWTHRKRVDRVLKKGDVAVFQIDEINRQDKTIKARLDRIPEVEGALMAIDNRSGAIRAMVGGFDFQYSQFNRATQAFRQPGSIFKPFTYVAAMESGYKPSDPVLDAPVSFLDGLGRVYAPVNDDKEFKGLIPIRIALAESRNVPTIRLANALGIEKVIKVAHRFGIGQDFPPYLPIALGAGELTLQEITSAFSTFPNGGVRAEPYFIDRVEDYNGITLEEHHSKVHEVVSPDVSSEMIYLLRSVVQIGTARRALELKRPVGGKTGTTNDSTDSWFVGFTPDITAGVWAGYDEKKSLGERVYGATLALPIWVDFMKAALKDTPVTQFQNVYSPEDVNLAQASPEDSDRKVVKRGGITTEDIIPPSGQSPQPPPPAPPPPGQPSGPPPGH